MKTYLILGFAGFLLVIGSVQAQTTAIPDINFENYLETHAQDGSEVNLGDPNSMGDGIANNALVLTNRISDVSTLNIADLEILDLTGIGAFTNLEILVANNNRLSAVDVSNNTNLSLLNVSENRITGELVVSNNLDIESLFCSSNQIDLLDLSSNTVLKNLDVSNNALSALDLSTINTVLCPNPQTDPPTPCQGNSLINVSRNQLVSLVVSNGFNELISVFDATGNPDLFCIQIDTGFTPQGWIKDDFTYYSDNVCVDIFTFVPDDNFEQALINNGLDDVLDNFVLTVNIENLTNLDVSNSSITSILGIEDFVALESLNLSDNTIEVLDLSANSAMLDLDVSNNVISEIDLTSNVNLVQLNCSDNQISRLELNNNTQLQDLNCSNNNLSVLDLSSNLLISVFDCSSNQIEQLDLSDNQMLTTVLCNNNSLFALNLNNANNTLITDLNTTVNPNLFCIQVDDVAFANGAPGWIKDATADYNITCGTYVPDDAFEQALIDLGIDTDATLNNFVPTADVNTIIGLDVSSLGIQDLTGIEDFILIEDLNISDNLIEDLNLNNNTALQLLNCSGNEIENLDLTNTPLLTSLICNTNNLQVLNIRNGANNILTTFDATLNPSLFCITVDDATVGNVPPTWQTDLGVTFNTDCLNNRFTNIPDPIFEQELINLGLDTVIDGQVLTSSIEHLEALNVSDKGITDLSGVRDFESLLELDCSNNFLEELDISNMTFLERLNCSSNFLVSNDPNDLVGVFNTNGTVSLNALFCAGNDLTNLNTSINPNLETLDCADNNIVQLVINTNTQLATLNCSNNDIENLDIGNNPNLITVNADSNALTNLSTSTIPNFTLTDLSCSNNQLTALQVNNYESLVLLNSSFNELTQINVSSNLDLVTLSLTNNQIANINLANNLSLRELFINQNELTQLNINSNAQLEQLNCNFNQLSVLDLSLNLDLQLLRCSNNQLGLLDIGNNLSLIEVNLSSNTISQLILATDLSTMKVLDASNNNIGADIDLTTFAVNACTFQPNQTVFCPEEISINLSNNLITFVNLQNGINPSISNFNTTGNPELECIQVDNQNSISSGWLKDPSTDYSEDCNFGETFVPDDNFEQALIDLGFDAAPLDDYVLTANIEGLTNLDVSGEAISDLTGIEDFLALQILNVSDNTLTNVDLTSNSNLITLDCSNNQLIALDITNNTVLTNLNCASNAISNIDFSASSAITNLDISDNDFTQFTPSAILGLEVFNCTDNPILNLDFQLNPSISSLSVQSNLLESLNVRNGQNAILLNLNAQNNPNLVCIESDNGTVPAGATWIIDNTAQLAIDCFFGETFVPDDNFEQALIDLGYDSGPLDDYVLTENIEGISFLDVSGLGIADATGIEAFASLTSLNLEQNTLTVLDIGNNALLNNLDVSGNSLDTIDVVALNDLSDLDVSNNLLTTINVSSNLNLTDLNVSGNALIVIDLSLLLNLEELICSANALTSLDVTQNPNLRLLFCQSNELVADQLNLQNGNNETIVLFNATNNPDLSCILVDDPVAVIANVNGDYDNWVKDDTASYQSICEDADNDGIANEDDLCPSTPFGAVVDLFGCELPDITSDNFAISILSETCQNSNNGQITIVAQLLYNYSATLVGDDFFQEYNFTNDIDILNLLAGTYEMCITLEEWPDFEVCYTIVITEPDTLSVFTSRLASQNAVDVEMGGSNRYTIEFNEDIFTTFDSSIRLDLREGVNTLRVSTGQDCQGTYQETFFNSNEFFVTPNPFGQFVNIDNILPEEIVTVQIYSIRGELVFNKIFNGPTQHIQINTEDLKTGLYLINLHSGLRASTFKIIKE